MCELCTIAEMQRSGKCPNCRSNVAQIIVVPLDSAEKVARKKRLAELQSEREEFYCLDSVPVEPEEVR